MKLYIFPDVTYPKTSAERKAVVCSRFIKETKNLKGKDLVPYLLDYRVNKTTKSLELWFSIPIEQKEGVKML